MSWGIQDSLLVRDEILCGNNRGDDNTRSCSNQVGLGLCLDGQMNYYPNCFAVGVTINDCEQVATSQRNAIGWEYFRDENVCNILFDATAAFSCPAKFNKNDDPALEGKGPIDDSDDDTQFGEICYACSN